MEEIRLFSQLTEETPTVCGPAERHGHTVPMGRGTLANPEDWDGFDFLCQGLGHKTLRSGLCPN